MLVQLSQQDGQDMENSLAVPLVSVAVVASVGIYYYFVKIADRCTCTKRLDGKTVIITGMLMKSLK